MVYASNSVTETCRNPLLAPWLFYVSTPHPFAVPAAWPSTAHTPRTTCEAISKASPYQALVLPFWQRVASLWRALWAHVSTAALSRYQAIPPPLFPLRSATLSAMSVAVFVVVYLSDFALSRSASPSLPPVFCALLMPATDSQRLSYLYLTDSYSIVYLYS